MQNSRASDAHDWPFPSPQTCAALRERDERLGALKAFAGKLAHDFRNALVPQLGYLALIQEQAGGDPAILSYLSKLESTSRKLEAHLDAILMATRPERRFSPKSCDFTAFLRRALDTWQGELPKGASIEVEARLAPCEVWVDQVQWSDAIGQLLRNAQFGLAAGGKLEMALRRRTLSAPQTASLNLADGDVFELVVRDDGFGMTESVLRRACEPFFSTRPKDQAVGLGLTIVHSVVRWHGGQLLLESEEDTGTTAVIWLPASGRKAADAQARDSKGSPATTPQLNRTKLLVVERDPLLLEVLVSYFRRAAIEVISASDVPSGLKLFQRHKSEWRAVVTSAPLPEASGLELCAEIRKLDANVPLIVIRSPSDALIDAGLPRVTVLEKPFGLKTLLEKVSAADP